MQNYQCRICNNTQGHQLVFAREMMFGFRDEFLYFKCPVCGCLQIAEIPKDLSKYYPNNYYGYPQINNDICNRFKRIAKFILLKAYICGLNISYLKHFDISWQFLLKILKNLDRKSAILDIGCAYGALLLRIESWGYQNLTGIDPFIKDDILYPSGVRILKQTIYEHSGKYDLIMLHHSFEHMPEPHNVFKELHKLLNDTGLLLIRIPVSDSFAFRKYQNNWYQLDAPRHFFLHTTKSISHLAKNNGFIVKDIVYDSTEHQILSSEKYCRDINLFDEMKYPLAYIKECRKLAKYLNKIKDGDQCCFVLKKQTRNI